MVPVTAPPVVAPVAMRSSFDDELARLAQEPVDLRFVDPMFSGHRRRRVAILIVAVMVLVVGGLVVLASISQARGGI